MSCKEDASQKKEGIHKLLEQLFANAQPHKGPTDLELLKLGLPSASDLRISIMGDYLLKAIRTAATEKEMRMTRFELRPTDFDLTEELMNWLKAKGYECTLVMRDNPQKRFISFTW